MTIERCVIPADWIIPRRIYISHGGKRGEALTDVQLVCHAGPYQLDILVREQIGPPHLDIVGLVKLGGRVYEPVSGLPVELVEARGMASIGGTTTDRFGEFDFQTARAGVYGLRVGGRSDAPTVLLWEENAA